MNKINFSDRITGMISVHADGAMVNSHRRVNEGVIVRFRVDVDPLPWRLFDMHLNFDDVTVSRQKMSAQQNGECLWAVADAVFLRQNVDGVLLRIGGHNVRIVSL